MMVGAVSTAGILLGGLLAFRRGNQQLSQYMMRARIVAQGTTVAIMAASAGYMTLNKDEGQQQQQQQLRQTGPEIRLPDR